MKKTRLPELAFLDVETTGLSPAYGDRICEIAILRANGRKGTATWQSLINPGRPISPGASAINGITDEMVSRAPVFGAVAPEVLGFLDGAVLVCHNARFDISFLSSELECCGRELPSFPVIDTLTIARRFFNFPSNSLGNIAAYLGIEVKEKHRALADVYTTHKIFAHFWSQLPRRGITTVEQILISNTTVSRPSVHPLIEEAIRACRDITLFYVSSTGKETKRVIRPLRIINRFDYLYLEAFCMMHSEPRTFRLDRILKMEIL